MGGWVLQQIQNWWLSVWTNAIAAAQAAAAATGNLNLFYLQIYFVFGITSLGFQFFRQMVLVSASPKAAVTITQQSPLRGFCVWLVGDSVSLTCPARWDASDKLYCS